MVQFLPRQFLDVVQHRLRNAEIGPGPDEVLLRVVLQMPGALGYAGIPVLGDQLDIERKGRVAVLDGDPVPGQAIALQRLVVVAEDAVIHNGPAGSQLASHEPETHEFLVLGQIGRAQGAVEAFREDVAVEAGGKNPRNSSRALVAKGQCPIGYGPPHESETVGAPVAQTAGTKIAEVQEVAPVEVLALRHLPLVVGLHLRPGPEKPCGRQPGLTGDGRPRIENPLGVHALLEQDPVPSLQPFGLESGGPGRLRNPDGLGRLERQQVVGYLFGLPHPKPGQLLADRGFQLLEAFLDPLVGVPDVQRPGKLARAVQDPVERVIVLGGNGVQLVVVAAGAGHRQTLKSLGEGVDLVVDHVGADFPEGHAVVVTHLSQAEESRPGQGLVQSQPAVDAGLFQHIAGHVFPDHLVEGQVLVEGPDEIVPVAPGSQQLVVPLVAVGFPVAHHVHPVTRPPFTQVRRSEKTVHQALVGVGGGVPNESIDFFGLGRQPGQHQAEPSDQGPPVARRGRLQPPAFQLRQNEPVHRMPRCNRTISRRPGFGQGLIGPVLPQHCGVELIHLARPARGGGRLGPGRAQGDPAFQGADLLGRQPAGRRHLQLLVANRLDQPA